MVGKRIKLILFTVLLFFVVCACSGFAYHYYGLDIEKIDARDGRLLGPKPKDDLSLDVCKQTATNKSPCVVLFAEEFFKMRRDYLEIQQRLKACEKQ